MCSGEFVIAHVQSLIVPGGSDTHVDKKAFENQVIQQILSDVVRVCNFIVFYFYLVCTYCFNLLSGYGVKGHCFALCVCTQKKNKTSFVFDWVFFFCTL